jgi:predicted Zn-dependent protease with MMP-like domain
MASLPARLHELLEEAPLIIDDCPSEELLEEMGLDPDLDDLCGLYSGIPLTERHHDASGELPETIHVFRRGIIDEAGGWDPCTDDDGHTVGGDDEVMRQIRITVLHEIGHHFGLSEEQLSALGYE